MLVELVELLLDLRNGHPERLVELDDPLRGHVHVREGELEDVALQHVEVLLPRLALEIVPLRHRRLVDHLLPQLCP